MLNPWKKKLWSDYKSSINYAKKLDELNDEQINSIQLERLQTVWSDCVSDVPYYKNLVKKGDAPSQIRTWDDFKSVPELTRDDLQGSPQEFVRLSGLPDLMRMTGGSTGTPVRFGVWKSEDEILRVLKLSLWGKMGYTPDSKLFLIWGHAHLLGTGAKRLVNHAIRKLKDWIIGYRRYDAYSLSPTICQKMARDLIKFHPDGVIGYSSAIDYFLRCTESYHGEFAKLNLRFVQSAGELPPRDDTFSLMERAFNAPVVQEYAGVDFGQVGFKEGKDLPFRIFADYHVVEARPGMSGEGIFDLGITTLYRRYTPLIKYRNGDTVENPDYLSNGFVKSFGNLHGRRHEAVQLHEGESVHSMAFLHCVHQEPSVMNIQLHLLDSGPKLLLATSSAYDNAVELRIRARLKQISPALENMPFEISSDVEVTVAGKRKWLLDYRTSKEL